MACALLGNLMVVQGEITSNFGVAGKNFVEQWPEIVVQFPEIDGSYLGTINVRLCHAVLVINFDAVVNFSNGHSYGFVRVSFEFPLGTEPVRAWLCLPHTSFGRLNMCHAEIVTKKINGIDLNLPCKIHYPRFTGIIV
jgi:hypothetical protein